MKKICLLLALCCMALSGFATVATINATSVGSTTSSTTSASMITSTSSRGFAMFDITGAGIPAGAVVSSVTLKFTFTITGNGTSSGTIYGYAGSIAALGSASLEYAACVSGTSCYTAAWGNTSPKTMATTTAAKTFIQNNLTGTISMCWNEASSARVYTETTVPQLVITYSSPPASASFPYTESFESTWINYQSTADAPNNHWKNTPATGDQSWRRDDDATTAGWSYGGGNYTPASSTGSHSARFDTYSAADGTSGTMDLYINLPTGAKQISYDYINPSGADFLICQISTDGGANFTTIDAPPAIATGWTTRVITTSATATTAIIRFKATSDFGNDDIGLDNVRVDVPSPTIIASSGSIPFGTVSTGSGSTQTFTLSGSTLTASGNITVTSSVSTVFQVSIDGTTWSDAITIPYTGTTLPATTVYARFSPATTTTYSGNLAIDGGGIPSAVNVSMSGTGIPPFTPPTNATVPFTEDFESDWVNYLDNADAPDNHWRNTPATGSQSWRRDDNGVSAGWLYVGGNYAPAASTGSHSARFDTYSSPAGTSGTLDLYMTLPAGVKQISYDYINPSGTDAIICQLSTDGGSTFTTVDAPPAVSASWSTRSFFTTAVSATAIIRFLGTSDYGYDDMGIDNVNVIIAPPTITTTSSSLSFGTIPAGTSPTPMTFSVTGFSLTPASSITLTTPVPTVYQLSADGSTWSDALTIPYTGGELPATTIYIRFSPTAGFTNTYGGNVTITGGGVSSTVNVAVTGTGVIPCTGTPIAGTATAAPMYGNASTPFTLSNTGYTPDGGISLQWQSAPDNTTWTNIAGATNAVFNFTGISAGTYYRCNVTCSGSAITVSTSSSFVSYFHPSSCTPAFNRPCTSYYTIARIASLAGYAGTITDTTSCGGTSYEDMTALNCTLLNGTTYNATIYGGNYYYTSSVQVWIDFNDDGVFQSTESVGGIANPMSAQTSVASLVIPAGANTGIHRMRIVGNYSNTYPSLSPCPTAATVDQGDARDYAVTISNPPPTVVSAPASVDFGVVTTGTSAAQAFSLSGYSLTTGPITVTAPANFLVSPTGTAGSWTTAYNISYTAPTLAATTAYLQFNPTADMSYSGNVTVTGGGISPAKNIAVTGTGAAICAGTPSAGSAAVSPLSGSISDVFTLSLPGSTVASGLTYQWQSSASGSAGSFTSIAGATTASYSFTGIGTNMYYQCAVTCPSAGTATSSPAMATFVPPAPGCTPNSGSWYWFPQGTAINYGINTFNITGFSGSALADAGIIAAADPISGYANRTTIAPVNLQQGGVYNATAMWGQTATTQDGQVWIDFNNNGTFEDAEQVTPVFGYSTSGTINPATFNITIPATAVPGIHLMRIRGLEEEASTTLGVAPSRIDPCMMNAFGAGSPPFAHSGDVADYYVTIQCASQPITGSNVVCIGKTNTLADVTPGGTWTSSDPSVAAIDINTGIVTGIVPGTATISYTPGCGSMVTATVTVNPTAGVINGTGSICPGATASLSNASTGGTWSSGNTSIAIVGTGSGIVTGQSGGTVAISYIMTTGCATSATMTVNAGPAPFVVTPASATLCSGGKQLLSAPAIAAINNTVTFSSTGSFIVPDNTPTGVTNSISVSGIPAGATIVDVSVKLNSVSMTYDGDLAFNVVAPNGNILNLVSNRGTSGQNFTNTIISSLGGISFGSSSAPFSHTYTADKFASAGPTGYLSNVTTWASLFTIPNGTWMLAGSDNAAPDQATVNSWSVIIHYTLPAGTYTWLPTTGLYTDAGLTTPYTGTTTNTVYASPTTTATYNATGSIAGLTCTVTNSSVITVSSTPNAVSITGASSVCTGSAITLSDGISGGVWSSNNMPVAAVGTSGIVSGLSTGVAVITYTVTNSCGTANTTFTVTVNPLPVGGSISGSTTLCSGTATTLSDGASGGVWSSDNESVASVGTSGIVTGNTSGNATISYSVTNGCGMAVASASMTVNPLPDAGVISGTASVCTGAMTTLDNAASGGVWSSGNASVASVVTTGIVTGVIAGNAAISYSVTNGCGTANTFVTVTVNTLPDAGSISGAGSVCTGLVTTLNDGVSGGVWSSNNTSVATVGTSGMVTGVATGNADISYSVTNNCGTASASVTVTVNASPDAGTISGANNMCAGAVITLSDGVSGGVWSSGNTSIATAGTSGIVTGSAAGNISISYSVTNGCGTSVATASVTVNAAADAGSISGASNVCADAATTLNDGVSGGVWSSDNTSVATVGTSGIVNGIAAGNAAISYTVTSGCGTATASVTISVHAPVNAGSISGTGSVCAGAATTLSDGVSGGVWSSSNTSVATVGATGIVNGIAAGNAVISYTVTNGCGNATATMAITINPLPNAGTITGALTVNTGSTITLSDAVNGGAWSAGNANATITAAGIVSGVTNGAVTISYAVANGCGTATATKSITVITPTGAISGVMILCAGTTTTLADTTGGGVWSSGIPGIATVAPTGVVTGISAGSATITYTAAGNYVTAVITVNGSPNMISGVYSACENAATTLGETTAGGIWTSTAGSGTAAVGTGNGIVTGISAGTATISYTLADGCASKVTVTINALPDVITGSTAVCIGTSSSLGDASAGGTWLSSAPAKASISAAGVLTGISAGTITITYTLTGGCKTTSSATVNPNPAMITGTLKACPLTSTTLADGTPGGTWSSSSAIVTVGSTGIVTGVSEGTANISYTVNGCATTKIVTINPVPLPIAGSTSICTGATTSLSDPTLSGSTWNSSNTTVATISNATGVATGIAAGTATISYIMATGCYATAMLTVGSGPAAITGTFSVIQGSTTTLDDATNGGAWSTTAITASIAAGTGNTGVVTGINPGTATVTYSTGPGCNRTSMVTIYPLPGVINGYFIVCIGKTSTMSDATIGGTWSCINNTGAATISAIGTVTGVSPGTVTIRYILPGGGTTSTTVTVQPIPSPSTGITTICSGATTLLTNTTPGGTWSTNNGAVAVIGTDGTVTGTATGGPGAANITYGFGNVVGSTGCYAITAVTVNNLPAVITGSLNFCEGATSTLADMTAGGTWTSASPAIASIGTAHITSGLLPGTAVISYTLPTTCARTTTVTVLASPVAGTLSGPSAIHISAAPTIALTDVGGVAGGLWSSSNTTAGTVDATGNVRGLAPGATTISYTVTNGSCSASATQAVTVTASRAAPPGLAQGEEVLISLYPNPSKGVLTLRSPGTGVLKLYTLNGKELRTYVIEQITSSIELPSDLAAGIYMCRFSGEHGENVTVRVVYEP